MNRLVRQLTRQGGLAAVKIASRNLTNASISSSRQQFSRHGIPCLKSFPSALQKRHFAVSTEKLESLGDSITTAVLLEWSKAPGDAVKEDDVIGVVETDKVTMEIRAKKAGVFVEALVSKGSEVAVGADIYKIDTAGSAATSAAAAPAPTPAAPAAAPTPAAAPAAATTRVEIPVPAMGDSITQGVLSEWLVKPGAFVKVDEIIAMIETDKVTVEVRSPSAGTIGELFASTGEDVFVGKPLYTLNAGGTAPASAPAAPTEKAAPAAAPATPTPAPAKKAEAKPAESKPAPAKAAAAPVKTESSIGAVGDRSETRVKMTRMRLRIAQRLKESQNTAAMLTTFQEVDMQQLIDMRNRHKDAFEKVHGVKMGFMSAFVRAATVALKEIPAVNAVIDDASGEIVYRNYIDMSVAVASPTGLVVPVLRNTEKMNFADVEKAIGHYSKKAKDGQLALEDMAGGTFTISNGGVFGSLFGTPIINPPQSAILGMHATKLRPVVLPDGTIAARPMMYLALTYDHRLIDGREAVTFLKSIQGKIEDPTRLLLDL